MTKLILILIKITGVKLTIKLSHDLLECVPEICGFLYSIVVDIKDICK